MSVLSELDGVLQLLEAKLPVPANPSSPRNEKLTRALERDVVDYFKALETALDTSAIEALYYKHVKQD